MGLERLDESELSAVAQVCVSVRAHKKHLVEMARLGKNGVPSERSEGMK